MELPRDEETNSITMNALIIGCHSARKKTTIVWTKGLRKRFHAIVEMLGVDTATPKKTVERMRVKGLTRDHVASYLQKYRLRLKKLANENCGGVNQIASKPTEGHSMKGMNNNFDEQQSSNSRLVPNHDVSRYDCGAFRTEVHPYSNGGIGSSSGVSLDQKNPTNIGNVSKSCDGNLDDLPLANGLLSYNANNIPFTLHPSNQGVNGQNIQDNVSYDASKNDDILFTNQNQNQNGYLPGSHPIFDQHVREQLMEQPIRSPEPLDGNMTYLGLLLMNSDEEAEPVRSPEPLESNMTYLGLLMNSDDDV